MSLYIQITPERFDLDANSDENIKMDALGQTRLNIVIKLDITLIKRIVSSYRK